MNISNMYQLEGVEYNASKRIHAGSRTCNARTRKPGQTGLPLFVICRKPILGFEPGVCKQSKDETSKREELKLIGERGRVPRTQGLLWE